jgi:hypothetical protein
MANQIRTDGRTDKEIRIIAMENISNLTDKQLDRWQNEISKNLYGKKKLANGGKVSRGRKANYEV